MSNAKDNGILDNVTGQEISVINDPFKKNAIINIYMSYAGEFVNKYWFGSVEFKNGNTGGKQKTPNCQTFDELIIHMKQILNSVNQ